MVQNETLYTGDKSSKDQEITLAKGQNTFIPPLYQNLILMCKRIKLWQNI